MAALHCSLWQESDVAAAAAAAAAHRRLDVDVLHCTSQSKISGRDEGRGTGPDGNL